MQHSDNFRIKLFRAVVLNEPLNECIPSIENEYANADFWEFLQWNRLIPLLFHTIKKQNLAESFSESFMEQLRTRYQKSIVKSLRMEMVITEVLHLLHTENIQPILLKGIALAYSVYENPAHRPMMDMDLLFSHGEEKKARQILLMAGAEEMYAEESPHTMGLWHHIPPLQYKGVMLELHAHLFASYEQGYLPKEKLFEKPCTLPIKQTEALTLQPDLQLYHLLVHMHKHLVAGYSRLIWLADIHYFIHHNIDNIEGGNVLSFTKNEALKDALKGYNTLLADILGTPMFLPQPAETLSPENFLSLCKKTIPGNKHIGTFGMVNKLSGWKPQLLFIAGKLFPSFKYIRHKFGLKGNLFVIWYYPVLYYYYVAKLCRIIGKALFPKP